MMRQGAILCNFYMQEKRARIQQYVSFLFLFFWVFRIRIQSGAI